MRRMCTCAAKTLSLGNCVALLMTWSMPSLSKNSIERLSKPKSLLIINCR